MANKYKKLDHREHVLKRSETYVGSKITEKTNMYVVDRTKLPNINIVKREVEYNPAFVKLFDEIIVNASDHAIRTGSVSYIKVRIENDKISVENDGDTVPIDINDDEKIYNPELIFGHLLTGENFDDDEDRIVGGRNGLGAKLTNIFSKKFIIECCDGKQKYKQTFKDNMMTIMKPSISKVSDTKSYTKITFYPDYNQFDFDGISDDFMDIMYKRCIDVAAYNPSIRVSINGKTVPVKSIKDYIKLHVGKDAEFFYEDLNIKTKDDNGKDVNFTWSVGIAQSPSYGFEQVSIVNGITTHRGGTHVNYLSLSLSKDIVKKMKGKKIPWSDVKNKLFLFVVCQIPNPTFDTQTKENLTNTMNSKITGGETISDKTIKKIAKSDIIQSILDEIELRERMDMKKIGKGKKRRIESDKLVDANKAGTLDSQKCHLALCEGDSATSLVVAGMSVVGRDYWGAFPLKGKMLNIRDASLGKIKNNDEVQNLIKIIGLEFGKKYTDTSDLRYGKVVITTDADSDGIHIKGLLMNFFEAFWPELLKMDFLYEFITPILKAKKGKSVKSFYTIKDYEKWLSTNPKGWTNKYYKGLGTSTPNEAKEYFKDIDNHLLPFKWDSDENHDHIDMVFNKKRADERKKWMVEIDPQPVDKYKTPTPISSFINNEMITYSLYDNIRSIPDLYDGLKPSQRKILFTCLDKNVVKEIGVAPLSGLVKQRTKYHHGERSLEEGITKMAQNFVGANNIPLLVPEGMFGTRLHGGEDSASPRYINTYLSAVTRNIFMKEDDSILNYLDDDGFSIEPETFKPIIPMVLVNGVEGIGTGWSTKVPMYDPKDIIRVIENKLNNKKSRSIHPKYKGFTGTISQQENNNYKTTGVYEKVNTTTIRITELPIGMWTHTYIKYLNKMIEAKYIKSFIDNSTEVNVDIKVNISRENMVKLNTDEKLLTKFKLQTDLYISNIHLFVDGKMTKFDNVMDIIDTFYGKRLEDYSIRKKDQLDKMDKEITKMNDIVKFIKMVIKGELKINNRKKELIIKDLSKNKFNMIDNNYDYLLRMPIYNLTKEKVDELNTQLKEKKASFTKLKTTPIEEMWLIDLANLKKMI